MTNEEAIAELNEAMDEISLGSYTYDGLKRSIALETGIKALEQEPVLDKIRAEIEQEIEHEKYARSVFRYEEKDAVKAEQCTGSIFAYHNVIKFIDKCKAERSDKE